MIREKYATLIKKGKTTDYVKRQYIGNLGKIENGIASIDGYGHREGMTFPLKYLWDEPFFSAA